MTDSIFSAGSRITRRTVLKSAAAAATLLAAPTVLRAQSGGKLKLGAPFHRTGIGASYGRWYERTAVAALKLINEGGGINGMEVEMIVEDDGTDPKRGTEVVEKFATEHKVDAIFEPADIHTARWLVFPDDLSRRNFEREQHARLGKDVDGNPVYLATSRYNLEVTMEKWPKVAFHATREHGQVLG